MDMRYSYIMQYPYPLTSRKLDTFCFICHKKLPYISPRERYPFRPTEFKNIRDVFIQNGRTATPCLQEFITGPQYPHVFVDYHSKWEKT